MKITTTREYDDEGRLVRETVETEGATPPATLPWGYGLYPSECCTCAAWFGVVPPPPCPVHGQSDYVHITCGSNTTALA